MMHDANIYPFEEERECNYKGEHYSVRDNGAVYRHAREGEKLRKYDNVWTFGPRRSSDGYLLINNHRVHIIVATAFHGENDSTKFVVDHIDTNRSNNRPENLRWLTKLENILLNEFTLSKVIYICGSLDAFLENPQLLFGHESEDTNFTWMRTVSTEEAKATRENLKRLATRPQDILTKGAHVGDWIFKLHKNEWQPDYLQKDKPYVPSKQPEKPVESLTVSDLRLTNGKPLQTAEPYFDRPMQYDGWGNPIGPKPTRQEKKDLEENHVSGYFATSNKLAQQLGWKPYTNPEFPLCPKQVFDNPLKEYAEKLVEGSDFVVASYGASTVFKHAIYENQLLVITRTPNGVKDFALARITWNGKVFVHESMGTYFEENGVMAAFTQAQGKEWNGPDSIDNYC